MNYIIYTLLLSIFFLDYLAMSLGIIPRAVTWLPELLSLVAAIIVLGRIFLDRQSAIPTKYKILLTILILHIMAGLIINTVAPGTVIAGVRNYLKFLPFFLLPLVYSFTPEQMRKQLLLLGALILLQTPLSLFQRFSQFAGTLSGDRIAGSIEGNSAQLAVICIAGIAVVLGFYLKKRIKLPLAAVVISMMFIPITLGEVKAALLFLPMAFFIPALVAREGKFQLTRNLSIMGFGVLALVMFVAVYDYLIMPRWGYGLMDFFTMEGRAQNYLYQGADPDSLLGSEKQIGRIDSWVLALKYQSQSVFQLLFGVGVGNASGSFIQGFTGEYAEVAARYGAGSGMVPLFIWEIGLVGLFLYATFIVMVGRDAMTLSKKPGFPAAFAAGWTAVTAIMLLGLFYKKFFGPNATSYLFWYFSGYVAVSAASARQVVKKPVFTQKTLFGQELHGESAARTVGKTASPG